MRSWAHWQVPPCFSGFRSRAAPASWGPLLPPPSRQDGSAPDEEGAQREPDGPDRGHRRDADRVRGDALRDRPQGRGDARAHGRHRADPAAGATATPATPSTPAARRRPARPRRRPRRPAAPEGDGGLVQASKGLPEDVAAAYEANAPIALLVIDPKAVADEQVEEWTDLLGARRDVDDLHRQDQGHRRLRADHPGGRRQQHAGPGHGPAAQAHRRRRRRRRVSTGFEGPRSVEQALDDALYDGRSRLPSEAYP